jgi:release factor glutamine methyltransferase
MPITIAQLLGDGVIHLKAAGVYDAEISARKILEYLLEKSPSGLQLIISDKANDDIIVSYNKLIQKRATHYPLQYIIGEVEFYNVNLKVDERVLIPRPETEVLVETALEISRAKSRAKILDIGTGSGNVAIAIAKNTVNAIITTVDISREAINLARANAVLNGVEHKIKFVYDDSFRENFWNEIGQFDLLVSNPPYIDELDYNTLQAEIRLYEPKLALVPNRDVLSFYEAIAGNLSKAMVKGGSIVLEVGANQALLVKSILEKSNPQIKIRMAKDLAGIDRIIIGTLSDK